MGEGSLINVGELNLEDINSPKIISHGDLAQLTYPKNTDISDLQNFDQNNQNDDDEESTSNQKPIEKTLSKQSSDSYYSQISVVSALEQFQTSLKDIGAYLMLNLTIAACATFKYFKQIVNRFTPYNFDIQQYDILEDVEIGEKSTSNIPIESDIQCMDISQCMNIVGDPQCMDIEAAKNLSNINNLKFESSPLVMQRRSIFSDDEDDTTTTDDLSSDDSGPLSEIQKAALMVQNNQNLSDLCNEESNLNFDANDLSLNFLTRNFSSFDDEADDEKNEDKENDDDENLNSISRIWEDISSSDEINSNLTGSILRSDFHLDGISRSATFQPTHAKLDFNQLPKNFDDTDLFDQQLKQQDLQFEKMAQVISTEIPEISPSSQIISNLNYSSQNPENNTCNVHALKLSVIKGPCTGYDCEFKPGFQEDQNIFSIGRYPDNYFILGDPEISGTHVRFQVEENQWYVVDVGSSNGTFLNDLLISTPDRTVSAPHKINIGDKLVLGTSTTIKIEEYCEPILSISGGNISLSRAEFSVNGHQIDWEQYVRKHGGMVDFQKKAHDFEEARETEVFECQELFCQGAYVTQQGRDHKDRGTLKEDFVQCNLPLKKGGGSDSVGLAMLFDGHGGTQAAQQCRHSVPQLFAQNMEKLGIEQIAPFGLSDVFKETFLEADDELGDEGSGCTATVLALQVEDDMVNMQMANVGDSSGIMLNITRRQFRELTHDHKVMDEQESARLDDLDVMRTHGGTRILGLNLARTLGDKFVKHANMGVIADPHVSDLIQFGTDEAVLVLMASDGLWDVLTFEEVAQIAGDKCIDGYEIKNIVEQLVDKAVARGSRDDISVLALLIGQAPHYTEDDNSSIHSNASYLADTEANDHTQSLLQQQQ